MKPREKRHIKTRKSILDSALSLVVSKGPDNLSLREIAKEVNYSPSGLYEYFENKEEIIEALSSKGFDLLAEYLKKVSEDMEISIYITKLGLAYLKFAKENPEYYRLIFNFIPSKRKSFEEPVYEGSPYRILLNAITIGIKNKTLKLNKEDSAESLSNSFWSLLHGHAMLQLTVLKDYDADFETINRRAINIFINGLLKEEE